MNCVNQAENLAITQYYCKQNFSLRDV